MIFYANKVPKGILLIVALFLMLGGSRIEQLIVTTTMLFIRFWVAPTTIPEGASAFLTLFPIILGLEGFLYLLIAYGLYNKTDWSWPLTIITASISAIYGFVSRGVTLLFRLTGFLPKTSTSFLVGGETIYGLVVAILMVCTVYYLRMPEVKEWFVSSNKEEQIESPL